MTPRTPGRALAGLRRLFPFLLLALLPVPVRAADAAPPWPFAPLSRPAVPRIRDRDWAINPIDAFVLAKLEQAGLRPNPPADRLTLIRRVTFDLTGLAPTLAESRAFLADASPDAYERLVDRLLASPHFGERWAQHWLDVVRFAETDGFKMDRLRPEAHRYRDYVIRSFNDDLPYDRFLSQQLAGDELEPANPDALVATGFFRLPPEDTVASNYREQRQDLLNDVTVVCGLTFLGMTVGCARCHDHKFDPITQKDYYALQAFFAPLEHHDDLLLGTPAARAYYRQRLAAWNEATRSLRAEMTSLLVGPRREIFEEVVNAFDPATQAALRMPPSQRTPLQKQLAALAMKQLGRKLDRAPRRLAPAQRARYDTLQKRLASFDALKPEPLPLAMAVTDCGPVSPPVHRLATGNYLRPREAVLPDFPEFLDPTDPVIRPPAGAPHSTGRRSALARWLCRPDHPLTARVIANRLWQHYLGRGIVGTPNDFGLMGEQATHPELLDWLATELVRRGWKLKAIHRLIVTSAVYRQASSPGQNPALARAQEVDADNHLLWHARPRRRDAESVRDVLLQASGQLSLRMYGPSAHPELPAPLMESRYAWDPDARAEDRNRRSVYVLARRNLTVPLFSTFDVPDRTNSCPTRPTTTTAPQALVMLNGNFAVEQARHLAGRLLAAHGRDTHGLIRDAYLLLFSRKPDASEFALAEDFLSHQVRLIESGSRRPAGSNGRVAAVVDFCHALMNSAEFLYLE